MSKSVWVRGQGGSLCQLMKQPVAVARFRGIPASVAGARRFVTEALHPSYPELGALATVIVSELAANAVLHGDSDFTVSVEEVVDGVRVAVGDRSTSRPRLQRPAPTDVHGRGLQIVSAMADAWGVVPGEGGRGKTVWFVVRSGPH